MDLKQMHFTITHPMHTHPYNPDVVSGSAIVDIAVAAEKAGFHGFGFTDHPAPSQRWLDTEQRSVRGRRRGTLSRRKSPRSPSLTDTSIPTT